MTPVRAVLDATAVLAYTHTNVAVGEIIAEVTDENCRFAVPHQCILHAVMAHPDGWPLIDILLAHEHALLIPPVPAWRDLAHAGRALGSLARGAAMLAAIEHEALLLTDEPDAYGDAGNVLGI